MINPILSAAQRAFDYAWPDDRLLKDADRDLGTSSLFYSERAVIMLRLTGSAVIALLLPFMPIEEPAILWGIIVFACSYSLIMRVLLVRAQHLLHGGYLIYCLDAITLGMAIAQSGGLESDFFVIYFPLVALQCLRFGKLQAVYAPLISAASYTTAIMVAGDDIARSAGTVLFRLFWIADLAVLLGLLVERGRRAETRLKAELRRTRALLLAAHAPAASLTIDGVVAAVIQQSLMLTRSEYAAVALWSSSEPKGFFQFGGSSKLDAFGLGEALSTSSSLQYALSHMGRPTSGEHLHEVEPKLPESVGQFTTVLGVPIRNGSDAFGLIVTAKDEDPEAGVHYEALSAFAERAALAIQNARLYERLQEQVDELQAMHDQIVRTERLAAIGEIAAKVAHELNNPLTSIHLYNSMLLEEPVDGAEQQRLAASMLEQVERAKRVVRDILDFSRPQESHPEIASLNATVAQSLQLVEHAARASGVSIIEDYAGGLPEVLVDTGQMAQIFTNLATNAIQAMPDGGKLLVRTGMQDEELFVSFADTGAGISLADRDRIFEPFFTTKAAGEGTGLGLSVVKGLVSRHHGRVTVDSESGRGSTFTVWLPPAMQTEREGLVARPQRR